MVKGSSDFETSPLMIQVKCCRLKCNMLDAKSLNPNANLLDSVLLGMHLLNFSLCLIKVRMRENRVRHSFCENTIS